MAKRSAKRVRRELTPNENRRWKTAVKETAAERDAILEQGRAVLAAKRSALAILSELKATRERRGLSLADMMRLTGMSRAAISRLENDQAPNPTVRTVSRYAEALGLEFRFDFRPRKGA
jgi:DNA-binding XRE family transcriptional regulator